MNFVAVFTLLIPLLLRHVYCCTHILQTVNGSRFARPMVEILSPNQTKYTITRTDPISRYRLTLSARTQVGAGEAVTADTPLRQDEGKKHVLILDSY